MSTVARGWGALAARVDVKNVIHTRLHFSHW